MHAANSTSQFAACTLRPRPWSRRTSAFVEGWQVGRPIVRLFVPDTDWGDWKCGSGKCDTGIIARVENAVVEKPGVDSRSGKCRSKSYGTPSRDYIERALSYFVKLVLFFWLKKWACYCFKIVAAFVFAYWWLVSYDICFCNYVIISSTILQFKQRHICNGRKTYTVRAKMNTLAT